jgi:hypothetical protein
MTGFDDVTDPEGRLRPRPPDTHPLIATPKVLREGNQLPSREGAHPPTGRVSRRSLDTMMSIAEALFSVDGSPPPAERMAYLRREYDDFMSRASARGRFYFAAGGLVVSIAAPLLLGAARSLRSLPLDRRIAALERFESSPIGSILIALRAILCLIYYEHPDSAKDAGLALEPSGRLR